MKEELTKALETTDTLYQELSELANSIVTTYTADLSTIIDNVSNHIETLTNDELRNTMLQLSMKAFSFVEIKEKSSLKAHCAEVLKDEAYAKAFNAAEGSAANKGNIATINISNEIMTETVYDLVASLMKSKLDSVYRLVDTLKTVLMSRLSEAKLSSVNNAVPNENPATDKKGRVILNEVNL